MYKKQLPRIGAERTPEAEQIENSNNEVVLVGI